MSQSLKDMQYLIEAVRHVDDAMITLSRSHDLKKYEGLLMPVLAKHRKQIVYEYEARHHVEVEV